MRPDWEHYFMEITEVVAKRSTCLRRNVGAILVKDKRILATGYNGAPGDSPLRSNGLSKRKISGTSGKDMNYAVDSMQNKCHHSSSSPWNFN